MFSRIDYYKLHSNRPTEVLCRVRRNCERRIMSTRFDNIKSALMQEWAAVEAILRERERV